MRMEIIRTDCQMLIKTVLQRQVEGLLQLTGIDGTIERLRWIIRIEHVIADDRIAHPRVVIVDRGGCLLREVMTQPQRPDIPALIFQIGKQLVPIGVFIGRRIVIRTQRTMHACIAEIGTRPLLKGILHMERWREHAACLTVSRIPSLAIVLRGIRIARIADRWGNLKFIRDKNLVLQIAVDG